MSQQINLFNPIFLKQKKVFAASSMAQALGVLVIGVALLAMYGNRNVDSLRVQAAAGAERLSQKQARLAAVNLEYAPRQRSKELTAELSQAEAELRALRDVGSVLQRGDIGNTAGYSGYFKALARQNVEGMWLTGVSIVGAGNQIAVQGRALDATMVPEFIAHLTREQVLRGKTFASLRIERPLQAPPGSTGAAGASVPAPFLEFTLQSVAGEAEVRK
ncbi:MAG: PilN domain-containing protein [Pseudomonadota bacterium]